MVSSLTDKLLISLDLDIGKFRFYPNLIISEMREGVTVNFDTTLPVFIKGLEYYTVDTPLVYISNRKNSYAFDPTLHLEVKTVFSNLKGYGVVVYDDINRKIALLEQNFTDCPVNIFNSMEEANNWAEQLISKLTSDECAK